MRALKIATVIMGVLIVFGTGGLLLGIMRKSSTPPAPAAGAVMALPASVTAVLDEPAGTRIVAITTLADRLAVQLQGGGVDRVVLIDPKTGGVAGRISLAR